MKSLAEIWKQQRYNNSCAWDCLSMLLNTQGVETNSLELVGSSQVPYQISIKPEENMLKAGMLVQKDRNVNAALGKFGFHLVSKRASTISEYIALARKTLNNGNAFITNVNLANNLQQRHASVFVEFGNSIFTGLDPDCRLDRAKSHPFTDVQETVTLKFTGEEFIKAVSGEEGFVPLLGVLMSCEPHEPEPEILEQIFNTSVKALEFYKSATSNLDFVSEESMPIVYSILKPILSDLRTAIAIRDEFLNETSEIGSFLKVFECEILEFRRLINNGEAIPVKLRIGLSSSLTESYTLLEKHLSLETYRRSSSNHNMNQAPGRK